MYCREVIVSVWLFLGSVIGNEAGANVVVPLSHVVTYQSTYAVKDTRQTIQQSVGWHLQSSGAIVIRSTEELWFFGHPHVADDEQIDPRDSSNDTQSESSQSPREVFASSSRHFSGRQYRNTKQSKDPESADSERVKRSDGVWLGIDREAYKIYGSPGSGRKNTGEYHRSTRDAESSWDAVDAEDANRESRSATVSVHPVRNARSSPGSDQLSRQKRQALPSMGLSHRGSMLNMARRNPHSFSHIPRSRPGRSAEAAEDPARNTEADQPVYSKRQAFPLMGLSHGPSGRARTNRHSFSHLHSRLGRRADVLEGSGKVGRSHKARRGIMDHHRSSVLRTNFRRTRSLEDRAERRQQLRDFLREQRLRRYRDRKPEDANLNSEFRGSDLDRKRRAPENEHEPVLTSWSTSGAGVEGRQRRSAGFSWGFSLPSLHDWFSSSGQSSPTSF